MAIVLLLTPQTRMRYEYVRHSLVLGAHDLPVPIALIIARFKLYPDIWGNFRILFQFIPGSTMVAQVALWSKA